jgi:hypothetical protein
VQLVISLRVKRRCLRERPSSRRAALCVPSRLAHVTAGRLDPWLSPPHCVCSVIGSEHAACQLAVVSCFMSLSRAPVQR